ncbi:hypothetical protein CLOM_g8534 [Closterium sp. NIES-68]|nr:hypothetical protein CLOM_g18706 [Closterium sp. NIES-68]GJP49309.1 hypothetical protein CLOM_g8534 [Closterium sp. NIES-68]GJP83761.1 hypothetical protein CLOP_g13874 [Closterium sp. NIES-67]
MITVFAATQGAAALSKLPNTPCEGDSSQFAHFWWPRLVRTIRGRSALETAGAGSDNFVATGASAAPRKLGAQLAAPGSSGPTFAEVLAASVATPGSADPAGAVSATVLPASTAAASAAAPAATQPPKSESAPPPAAAKTPPGKLPSPGKGTPASGAAGGAPASLPAPAKHLSPDSKSAPSIPKTDGPTPKQTHPAPKINPTSKGNPTPKQANPTPKQPASLPKLTPDPKPNTPGPKQTSPQPKTGTLPSKPATLPPKPAASQPEPASLPPKPAASARPLATVRSTASSPLATTKAVNSTGNSTTPAGNSTVSAGNSTTPPAHAVGSRDCQYLQLKQLHTCAVGYARSAGIRGGQWPTSSLFEVETEVDTLEYAKLPEKSLRYALMYLPQGAIITFSRSMEIVLQGNLFVRSRVTIDGRGVHVRITNGSIVLQNVNDVIIHNIEVSGNPRGDLIPIYNSSRVWIDHCRLQDALTGTVDVAKGSTDVTISNCYISSRGQTMQLGLSDAEEADKAMRVTVYRNWFNASGSMQPLCRKGSCHVANNVYSAWSYYCLAARRGALVRSEKNFFRPAQGSARREVTPWYRGMPATDVWYDASVTIASFQDYLAGGATFNTTAYAGATPIFTPPYALSLPRNPRQMEAILKVNCGPKYDAESALPPASSEFLPPAPPAPTPTNTTNTTASTTATANTTAAGNSTVTSNTTSPPSSNDCQYSPSGAGIGLGNCSMGFAAAGLVGGAAKTTYVVTLEEDSTSATRQGSLRWGIANFYKTGAYIKFARDMTIQLVAPLYVKSFMTLDGRGVNVKIVGDSLLVQHSTQVIIHNIEFSSSRTAPATISLYNSSAAWIDHCRFSNLSASTPAIELARNSTAVTISNSHFQGTLGTQTLAATASPASGTGSALHLGQSDGDAINSGMNVTIYRNWFESLSAMQPLCRLGKCDVANNLYTNWTGSAVEARAGAQVLLQSNLFISGSDSVQVVANTTSIPPGTVAEAANSTNTIKSTTGVGAAAAMGPTVNASLVFSPPYEVPLGDPSTLLFTVFMKLNAGPHAN